MQVTNNQEPTTPLEFTHSEIDVLIAALMSVGDAPPPFRPVMESLAMKLSAAHAQTRGDATPPEERDGHHS